MFTVPKFTEVLQAVRSADRTGFHPVKVKVLRNITIDHIAYFLPYCGVQNGLDISVQIGDFDTVYQDAASPDSTLIDASDDVVLLFTRLDLLSPLYKKQLIFCSEDEIQQEYDRIEQYIEGILAGIRSKTNAQILWVSFEPALFPENGTLDRISQKGKKRFVHELNLRLDDACARQRNAFVIDMPHLLQKFGAKEFYDERYWYSAKAPYSMTGMFAVAEEAAKYIKSAAGKSKKCLVLDCDNTLWGGIIGEDGLAGIALGGTYPGNEYLDFQKEIVKLSERGVIIALNSKNNEEDVWEVFETHPDMALKRKHIAAAKINWTDKAANIRELAKELNIGLDSIVFMDDNEFEVNLVRSAVPEVTVIHVPKEESYANARLIASCGLFDTVQISEEDAQRTAMYQAESKRREIKSEEMDMESYLTSLGMELRIEKCSEFTLPRIAQLTQKTNQFNLTTKRYTEADISFFSESGSHDVFALHLADSFGDIGLVGALITEYEGRAAHIDTLLMSCRALGRQVEGVFLRSVLSHIKSRNFEKVHARYVPTAKNGQTKSFYQNHGFSAAGSHEDAVTFEFDLSGEIAGVPGFFKNVHVSL